MFFAPYSGKRLLYILVSLALCVLCLVYLAVPAGAEDNGANVVNYTSVVYLYPDDDAMVIGHMEENTPVKVLEDCGDFYEIDCYDMTGYIPKEQVEIGDNQQYYVNCGISSPHTRITPYLTLAQALTVRGSVLALAQEQLGVPYVMGGISPSGFDCSGFVSYVFKNNGFSPRRIVSQQLQDTVIISREDLQPGDLVFFQAGGQFTSHVAIYVGDNQIIHAGNAGIGYADLDWSYFANHYLCSRRLLNVDLSASAQMPSAASMVRTRMVSARLAGNAG